MADVLVLANRTLFESERERLLAERLPSRIETPAEYEAVAAAEARYHAYLKRVEGPLNTHVADALKVHRGALEIKKFFVESVQALKAQCRELLGEYRDRELRARRLEELQIADAQRAEETARREQEAAAFEADGQPEVAEAVRAQPLEIGTVVIPSAVPDVAGLSFREDWFWEPVGGDTPANRARTLALWLIHEQRLPFVKLDDAGLTAFAKRTKGAVPVPGIVFRSRQVPVRR
jgi:hypothetical protein